MTDNLLEPSQASPPATQTDPLAQDLAAALHYARNADAPNTRRAYEAAWRHFTAFCQERDRVALPADPTTVAAYLAHLAPTHKEATLSQRLSAIVRRHRDSGQHLDATHPAIRETRRGIRVTHGTAPEKAAALMLPEIQLLVASCKDNLAGLRDRAMILLGFAAALRRSELVAVEREHIRFNARGLSLHIPASKTDRERKGEDIGIPRGQNPATDPVAATEAWIRAAEIEYGPLFRKITLKGIIEPYALHPASIRRILTKRANAASLDPAALGGRISPHGLRAGFITEAYAKGLRDEEIMGHSRHRDPRVMRGYVRRARLLTDSPAGRVGL